MRGMGEYFAANGLGATDEVPKERPSYCAMDRLDMAPRGAAYTVIGGAVGYWLAGAQKKSKATGAVVGAFAGALVSYGVDLMSFKVQHSLCPLVLPSSTVPTQ
jgi:hypothetical protein